MDRNAAQSTRATSRGRKRPSPSIYISRPTFQRFTHLPRRPAAPKPQSEGGSRHCHRPGSAGGYPPAPPQTRTCPIKACGSSSAGHANLSARQGCYGYRLKGLCVPTRWPSLPQHQVAPFPTPRLRQVPFACFPRYYEATTTTALSTQPFAFPALCPVALDRLVLFARRDRPVRHPSARALFTGCAPFRSLVPRDRGSFPGSQRTLSCLCPALRSRSDLGASPVAALRYCPRAL